MKKLFNSHFTTQQADWALLFLRVFFSFFMVHHGLEKLYSFMAGEYGFPDPLHIGAFNSKLATIFAEFVCSILLFLGLGTRLAAGILAFTMLVAGVMVHWNDSLGDKEHALMYLGVYIVLMILGGGKYALDRRFFK